MGGVDEEEEQRRDKYAEWLEREGTVDGGGLPGERS